MHYFNLYFFSSWCFIFQFGIAIGQYDTIYADGWRRATAAEWRDPAFQAALVQAHQEGGGWALLEEPLECNAALYVADGLVQIDGSYVAEVGFDGSQRLRGVYPAINLDTKVAWTTTAPALGNDWTIYTWRKKVSGGNPPCLFVQV